MNLKFLQDNGYISMANNTLQILDENLFFECLYVYADILENAIAELKELIIQEEKDRAKYESSKVPLDDDIVNLDYYEDEDDNEEYIQLWETYSYVKDELLNCEKSLAILKEYKKNNGIK